MGLAEFLDFDPVSQASAITTPTMVVHSDGCAFPDEANNLYSELRGQKNSCGPTEPTSTTTTRPRRSTTPLQT
jgi:hypothetical protein